MERACERCAGEDDELALVRPRGSDRPELWCDQCRTENRPDLEADGQA